MSFLLDLFLYGPLDQMILKDRQSLMVETPLSSIIKIDDFLHICAESR